MATVYAGAFFRDSRAEPPVFGGLRIRPRLMTDPVDQLTEGQRDCLRLVFRHMTSKDTARTIGISPHTADMRLRTAMRTLGVTSRIEAARPLDAKEAGYQPLIYQPPELARAAAAGEVELPVGTTSDDHAQQQSDTWSGPAAENPAGGPPRPAGSFRSGEGRSDLASLAHSLPWGAKNRLAPGTRLAWIAMIAIGSALVSAQF